MRAKVLKLRGDYYTDLGKDLYRDPASVDANKLLADKAFFRGALYILNDPVFTRKALERAQAQGETDE